MTIRCVSVPSLASLICVAASSVGCSSSRLSSDGVSSDGGDSTTSTSRGDSTSAASTTRGVTSTGTDASSTTGADETDGNVFLPGSDTPPSQLECSPWTQDCVPGDKCVPWAWSGGDSPDGTKCAPVPPDPDQLGDPCTVEGAPWSGVDSCDVGAVCIVDNPANNGVCVGLCMGLEEAPTCADPTAICSVSEDWILSLCNAQCDPLAQACGDGEACYPLDGVFRCLPQQSGGTAGAPCQYSDACDPGLLCVLPEHLGECDGEMGCCTPYCDATDEEAATLCNGDAGEECVPFEPGSPGAQAFPNVGICRLPEP